MQYHQVLNRLKNTSKKEVISEFSYPKLRETIECLKNKYSNKGINTCGIQIINNKELTHFLGEQSSEFDLSDKIGLCIAVGDKNAPIEQIGKFYETVTMLVNPIKLK